MGANSRVGWCHHTFNGWIGCAHRSDGCRFCYAEALAKRWGWTRWGVNEERRITSKTTWKEPRRWNREAAALGERHRVFCSSLADVFDEHPGVVSARADLFELIKETPYLDWLLLTKRPENISEMLPTDWGEGYPNVWLGTTVEDDRVAWRVEALLRILSAVYFVSYEPALGPIHDRVDIRGVNWLICGGESGAQARPMRAEWARGARDLARETGAAFFMKQLGAVLSREVGVAAPGEKLEDFPEDLRIQEFPIAA